MPHLEDRECPLRAATGRVETACIGKKCAWYNALSGFCMITTIGLAAMYMDGNNVNWNENTEVINGIA